jgi:hypothetical protein
MRVRSLATALVLAATGLAFVGLHDASADPNWAAVDGGPAHLPKGTDMSNPANWPNDPGYTTDWNYWSWLPKKVAGSRAYVPADVTLGASGMHIDQAWTYTTGRPDVKIAIIDCGIEWDHTDLANKEYLSAAELSGAHQPQNAMGVACPAVSSTVPALGYDCDGDGVFTAADYRDDPRISPMVATTGGACGGMTIKGDVNVDCVLDAGDLIQLFSDGVDDDNNGYVDDISGWDFYKNDNNPYDDTKYGHGTGEAEDSSDEGNNGQGDIGVCPDCRFMMLRAGDSFIADATDFAKGVVYAADNGAKVVQEALGTVDQTAFSRAAIDYAYAHGTAVIASMADENSRHHNMPGLTNHTLPVHAITNDSTILQDNSGVVTTDATTFIAFNTCSNYGGQNMLSVSGTACSSEATGKGAGLAALIFSEGANQGLNLSPEEVMQLMKMNADLIDVPESLSSDPNVADQFYESLPYFSQRFGYGRPNMLRTMEAIDAKMIPPEVDLVSPAWFETLYADRTTSPVPVVGRIAASRAPSYDYIVEWAPGVEPADSAFQPLSNWVRNINGTTATGGPDMPLTTLVPGQLNTTHVPDPDSRKFGENDRTITLRVRAIAHYPGGDVQGQARRSIAIVNNLPTLTLDASIEVPDAAPISQGGIVPETITHNGLDPDLLQGFPINMGASVETSPKLIDIDGDGIRDIVAGASDGSMHVFSIKSGSPVELPGFPYHTSVIDGLNPDLSSLPTIPSYLNAPAYKNGGVSPSIARESIVGSPAVGDVNSDGKNDIVFSTWQGSVYAVGSSGKALPGWPKRLPLIPSCPLPQDPSMTSTPPCMDPGHKWSRGAYASPVLADFDGNHGLEIVQAAFDGNIYVWHGDGTALSGFPVAIHGSNVNSYNRIMTTPAVADFNGDGIPDLATGSNEEIGAGGGAGNYYLVDGRGMNAPGGPYLPHWPISMVSLHIFPVVAEGTDSSPAIADFTGSGHPEVLFQGNGAPPFILPADPGEQHFPSDPPNRLPVYDTDAGRQVGLDPTSLFGPGTKAFYPDTMFPLFSHPSVGDLDQDGVPDIIMTGGSLSLVGSLEGGHPGGAAQDLAAMWSGATGHMFYGAPVPIEDFTFLVNEAVADINGDGYPEVILGTGGYNVRAFDACGCEAKNWPKFTDSWLIATPAVGDIDGDHSIEVVTGTRDGYLYAWRTSGTDTGVIQWESFHHDNANTGNFGLKLDQGVLRAGTQPLDCSLDCTAASAPTSSSYAAGGCACRAVTARDEQTGAFALAVGLGLAGVLARRTRRRR